MYTRKYFYFINFKCKFQSTSFNVNFAIIQWSVSHNIESLRLITDENTMVLYHKDWQWWCCLKCMGDIGWSSDVFVTPTKRDSEDPSPPNRGTTSHYYLYDSCVVILREARCTVVSVDDVHLDGRLGRQTWMSPIRRLHHQDNPWQLNQKKSASNTRQQT